MDQTSQLEKLLDLARDLDITVRFALAGIGFSPTGSSNHPGGCLVRLRNTELLFIDPSAALADQIDAAREALEGREELANRYLSPDVRELLEPGNDAF